MSLKIDLPFKVFTPEKSVPAPKTATVLSPKTANEPLITKNFDNQWAGNNIRWNLEQKLNGGKLVPFDPKPDVYPLPGKKLPDLSPPLTPDSLTAKDLQKQQVQQLLERAGLAGQKAANDRILEDPKTSIWQKIKAFGENVKVTDELDQLTTKSKITDEHLAAIERGDQRAVAFFDAMDKTNATGDPWDMNPGDAFRESLDPEAQKVYDATLAQLRNDPRVQFEFGPGTVDNQAFREIALRGMVAATFGRPQDLEEQIAQAAANSDSGKYTITFRPDNYVGPDGGTGWGARAGRDGVEAKQGFTIQQIANENDNLFIHEFSHTLQSEADGRIDNLPKDFGFINSIRFQAAFNDPDFQKYIGQTKVDGETFPGIQNRFRQNPQELKNASPEMYQLMVEYSGFDPLSGSLK